MYRYRYLNPHSQFGRTSYTLILQDLEGEMPDVRIEKEFNKAIKDIDDEFLYQEAANEIRAAQDIFNANLPSDDTEGEE